MSGHSDKRANEAESGPIGSFIYWTGVVMTALGVARLVGPYISNALKKIRFSHDDAIAKIKFEADESFYTATFNIKNMKWMLTGDVSVDTGDIISFFRTKFFITFLQSCGAYISPIIENENVICQNIDKISDSKSKQFIKSFFKYKDRIMTNMFSGTYLT